MSNRSLSAIVILASYVVLCATVTYAQTVRGTVRVATGESVVGAEVTVTSTTGTVRTLTSPTGHFALDNVTPPATVTVLNKGFKLTTETWTGQRELDFLLQPVAVEQQIVVTATRSEVPLGDVAASVTRIGREELGSSPALQIDEVLRQVPGFSLFRRSDSRTANPTSQGVSLRGLGASGASRALVLLDGIPLNDPFGGWVYWDRVPLTSVGSVEVLRGGGSALYGSGALAGVVNIARQNTATEAVSFDFSAGNLGTQSGTMTFSERFGQWGIGGAAQAMQMDGYIPVPADIRGRADALANLRYGTSRLAIDHRSATTTIFVSGSFFSESRQNGTVLQTNSTRLAEGTGGIDTQAGGGTIAVRLYGSAQHFNQTFSSVSADRNTETLVRQQAVPSQQVGASAQWVRPLSSRNVIAIGADLRQVRGITDEVILIRSTPSSRVIAGGRQMLGGVFAEDMLQVGSRLHITAAVRLDSWRNYDASSTTIPIASTSTPEQRQFAARSAVAFSPSVGAVYQLTRFLALTGSGYGAFRSPTLNELYRTFRLGNVQTLANDGLLAERLRGVETGVNLSSGPVFARANFFWNTIHDAIGNRTITITITPDLITRQRQNIGVLQARGLETEVQANLRHNLWIRGGYEYSNSTVARSLESSLVGLAIPQVPHHAVSTAFGYLGKRVKATLVGRYVGRQFEDDLNQFVLPGYFTADTFGGYRFADAVEVYIACENLLDRDYFIGRTPVPTLGAPRSVRAGIRLRWSHAQR